MALTGSYTHTQKKKVCIYIYIWIKMYRSSFNYFAETLLDEMLICAELNVSLREVCYPFFFFLVKALFSNLYKYNQCNIQIIWPKCFVCERDIHVFIACNAWISFTNSLIPYTVPSIHWTISKTLYSKQIKLLDFECMFVCKNTLKTDLFTRFGA